MASWIGTFPATDVTVNSVAMSVIWDPFPYVGPVLSDLLEDGGTAYISRLGIFAGGAFTLGLSSTTSEFFSPAEQSFTDAVHTNGYVEITHGTYVIRLSFVDMSEPYSWTVTDSDTVAVMADIVTNYNSSVSTTIEIRDTVALAPDQLEAELSETGFISGSISVSFPPSVSLSARLSETDSITAFGNVDNLDPPLPVTGFTVTPIYVNPPSRRTVGFDLSWDESIELDVDSYTIEFFRTDDSASIGTEVHVQDRETTSERISHAVNADLESIPLQYAKEYSFTIVARRRGRPSETTVPVLSTTLVGPANVDLGANLSEDGSISATLRVIPDVKLEAEFSETGSLTAKLRVDRPPTPGQVTDIRFSSSHDVIALDWFAVLHADDYEIQWAESIADLGDDEDLIEFLDASINPVEFYEISSLDVETTYYVRIRARRHFGSSTEVDGVPYPNSVVGIWSSVLTVTTLVEAPGRISNLTATVNLSRHVVLEWDAPSDGGDVGSYRIERRIGTSGAPEATFDSSGSIVTYTDVTSAHDFDSDISYNYIVFAVNVSGNGGSRELDVTVSPSTPGQVIGVVVVAYSDTRLDVSWSSVLHADDYRIQWRVDGDVFDSTNQHDQSVPDTTHSITSLSADTEYFIQVTALRDDAENGLVSAEVSVATYAHSTPNQVDNLSGSVFSHLAIDLSWDAVNDPVSTDDIDVKYVVEYRRLGLSGDYSSVLVNSITYRLGNLSSDTSYSIRVYAIYEGSADGDRSEVIIVRTDEEDALDSIYHVLSSSEDVVATMPIVHVGTREIREIDDGSTQALHFTNDDGRDSSMQLYITTYAHEDIIADTIATITADTLSIIFSKYTDGVKIQEGSNDRWVWILNNDYINIPLVLKIHRVVDNISNIEIDLFNGVSGELIVADTKPSGNSISFDDDALSCETSEDVSRLYYVTDNDVQVWYGGIPSFVYKSDAVVALEASVVRGRDSQRQLTPPRVPAMRCKIWDHEATEDGSSGIYYTRPYVSGTEVSLLGMLPGGECKAVFTGVVDTVGYKFNQNLFTYTINALGMTSRLTRDKLYSEVLSDSSVAKALRKVLSAADWGDGFSLTDSQFSTILSYWWLSGETGWQAIQRLVNTEGPPSTFYENNLGELVFFGTGRTAASLDRKTIGDPSVYPDSFALIGNVQEQSEVEYVVNHAELDVVEYIEPEEDDEIWRRNIEFRILPGATYDLTATFSGPVIDYLGNAEPSFMSTLDSLSVSYIIEELSATRAVMRFDNSASSQVARVRNVIIRGRALEIGAKIQVTSDGIENTISTVSDSETDHGSREWPGNVYPTIAVDRGTQLVRNIVQNYHEGVDTFFVRIYGDTSSKLSELLLLDDTLALENEGIGNTEEDRDGRLLFFTDDIDSGNRAFPGGFAYLRKYRHRWEGGFYYVELELESRSLDFFGVLPFIIGGSTLDSGAGYSA